MNEYVSKKKPFGLSSFLLKFIAAFLMTLDHVGLFFFNPGSGAVPQEPYYFLRAAGKMSFPIFAFLAVESLYHTKHPVRYLLRLGVAAAVLEIAGYLFGLGSHLVPAQNPVLGNAFTDLFLGVLMLYFLKKKNWWSFFGLVPFALGLLSCLWINDTYGTLIKTDWSAFGVTLFLFLFLAREGADLYLRREAKRRNLPEEAFLDVDRLWARKGSESVALIFTGLLYYVLWRLTGSTFFLPGGASFVPVGTYCVLAFLFYLLYNGERGYSDKHGILKWIFYLYYPLHLLLLAVLSLFFGVLAA